MKYCVKCGSQLDDHDAICRNCGLIQPISMKTEYSQASPAPIPARPPFAPPVPSAVPTHPSALPFFVWSTILVLLLNPVGTPLGVIASIFSTNANAAADYPSYAKDIKIAKILCIVGTAFDAASIILAICLIVAAILKYFHLRLF